MRREDLPKGAEAPHALARGNPRDRDAMRADLEHLWSLVEALLAERIALQESKVLGLARRSRDARAVPATGGEDASLGEADLHYEDGLLAGLQAALAAVRARHKEERDLP